MQERHAKLKKILRMEEISIEFDSDEDYSDKQPKVGDQLDYK